MTLGGYFTRSQYGAMLDDPPVMAFAIVSAAIEVAQREGVEPVGALSVRHSKIVPELGFDEAYVWELRCS